MYAAYGRKYATTIPLPLQFADPDGDFSETVSIDLEKVTLPQYFPYRVGRVEYVVSGKELTVLVPGIALFRISSGAAITVDAETGYDDPVLGYCIVYLILPMFLAFEAVILHGSAVVSEAEGRRAAVVLIGGKGSGKSTTAAHLSAQGWRLLSDDIVPVGTNGMVLPGLALAKLLPDALESLSGLAAIRQLGYDNIGKFQVRTPETQKPARLAAVCILSADPARATVASAVLRGREKVGSIIPHVVSVEGIHTHRQLFSVLTGMVAEIPVYRLARPSVGYPSQLSDYIIRNIDIGA